MLAFGLNVSAQEATFIFNEADSYQQFGLAGWSHEEIADGDITEEKTITSGDVTLTVTPSTGNTATRMYVDFNGNYSLRIYSGAQLIIKSSKNISKISFPEATTKKFNVTASAGKLDGTEWTSNGESVNEVSFAATKSTTIYKVVVTLGEGGGVNPNPDEPEPEDAVADNIAALKALCTEAGTDVTLNLTDAKILYVNEYDNKGKHTQNVYVRDNTGAIMFYNLGLVNPTNGGVINGTIKGAAKDFHGTMEFCTNANTDAAALNIVEGSLATAVNKNVAEVTNDDISDLVAISDVNMITRDEQDSKGKTHTNFYLVDANGNELQIYNKYHVEAYNDLASMVGQEGLSFIGIINLNWGKLEICPIDPAMTGIDCIENVELDSNAPMYNVAGQRVDANFKGIILQNGKKFINK